MHYGRAINDIVLGIFLDMGPKTNEGHAGQVSRQVLIFTVEMALAKASGLWPRKQVPVNHGGRGGSGRPS